MQGELLLGEDTRLPLKLDDQNNHIVGLYNRRDIGPAAVIYALTHANKKPISANKRGSYPKNRDWASLVNFCTMIGAIWSKFDYKGDPQFTDPTEFELGAIGHNEQFIAFTRNWVMSRKTMKDMLGTVQLVHMITFIFLLPMLSMC